MPVTAAKVDPDLFNPFTPIPYHNNLELKYAFAHVNMRNYIDKEHLNVDDYIWKSFHDSYDHGDKKKHMYNWTSIWDRCEEGKRDIRDKKQRSLINLTLFKHLYR